MHFKIKRNGNEAEYKLSEEENQIEIFDLSSDVNISELSDQDLLFRESIIKAFYDITVRTNKPVHGFSKNDLENMQSEIVDEFNSRGREYAVPLNRCSTGKCDVSREGAFENVDVPREIKEILTKSYASCREEWLKYHPADVDDDSESGCSRVAWEAVKKAGYFMDNDGKWKKRGSTAIGKSENSNTKFFRFITDPEVRLRQYDFETAKCEFCQYFNNQRCNVLEHMVQSSQVCDAYSGDYLYGESNSVRKYSINNFNSFLKGLSENKVLDITIVRSLDTPAGILIIMKDNMRPIPHYFSITMNEFIENTIRRHHWTQEEVDRIAGSGGYINAQ